VIVLSKPAQPVRSDFSQNVIRRHEPLSPVIMRRPRILIVEDDSQVREALAEMITACDCEVSLAGDGVAAIISAERDAPDLVLTDLMLPKRSGITVLDQLKARRIRRVPVVLMSGSRDPRHSVLATQHGADAFLLKPFDELDFLHLLHELLPHFQRQLAAV
jgi:CheY-like chemotaxis protein